MDQTQAKSFVTHLATSQSTFQSYAARATRLIDHPDEINQSVFGICGLTVMVRSLLQYDLQKFTELLSAIFEDKPFNGIQVGPGKLLGGRVKQWKRKQAHNAQDNQPSAPANQELDFILSRSLGKLLKQQAPEHYRRLLDVGIQISPTFTVRNDDPYVPLFKLDQKYAVDLDAGTISDSLATRLRSNSIKAKELCGFGIDPTGAQVTVDTPGKEWTITLQDKDRELTVTNDGAELAVSFFAYYPYSDTDIWQKDGDLALGQTGVSRLMRNVIEVASYKFTETTTADPMAAITAVNGEFDKPKPYVYAFVNGADAWLKASPDPSGAPGLAGQFEAPAPPPTAFWGNIAPFGAHILAITGKITESAGRVRVPVWTWADSFTVDMPLANVAGYLPGCCHGQL